MEYLHSDKVKSFKARGHNKFPPGAALDVFAKWSWWLLLAACPPPLLGSRVRGLAQQSTARLQQRHKQRLTLAEQGCVKQAGGRDTLAEQARGTQAEQAGRRDTSRAGRTWDRRHDALRSRLSAFLLPAKYHPSPFFRHPGTTGPQIREEFWGFFEMG